MDLSDFAILDDAKQGSDAFINDTIIHNVAVLLWNQFPRLQGMQDTTTYRALDGFERIDPSRPFVQIMHAGFEHWCTVTNIGLTDEDMSKGSKVLMYDSMIQLDKKNRPIVPPAVLKQVAQLLKTPPGVKPVPIDVIVKRTQQQNNYHACGLHAIANAISLAFGEDPSNVVFSTGKMRSQLVTMFEQGTVSMFDHVKETLENKGSFKVRAGGRFKSKIDLKDSTVTFLPVCYCKLPREIEDVIICDSCNQEFHASCNLIKLTQRGKASVIGLLRTWVCLNCRKSGEYNNGFLHKGEPDNSAIHAAEEAFKHLTYSDLSYAYNRVLDHNRAIPSTVREYQAMEEMIVRFDLNSLCQETGVLYVALKNFYNSFCEELPMHVPFEELTKTHLLYFALKLLCRMEGKALHPITTHSEGADLSRSLEDVMKNNRNSLNEAKKHIYGLLKEMRTLMQSDPNHPNTRDLLSTINHNIDATTDKVVFLQTQLENSIDKDASMQQKAWKAEVLRGCASIQTDLDQAKQMFEDYLCNQYN
jgi:hypothetical protein